MIEIKHLTEFIQDKLTTELNKVKLDNNLLQNIEFKLFTDTGKFEEDLKNQQANTVTEFINGVITPGMTDKYVLSNGVEFTNLPLRLELIVRLEEDEFSCGMEEINLENGEHTFSQEFIGNSEKLSAIRQILDNAFDGQQLQEIEVEENGNNVTYVTTVIAQISNGDNRDVKPIIGYSFTYVLNFYFSIVANGLNSRSGVFYLDGIEVPYSAASFFHIKNADQNLFSNANGRMVGVPTFRQTSFTFDIPALKNSYPTTTFLQEALNKNQDTNKVHVLKFAFDNESYEYLVNVTEIAGSLSGLQNVGLKVTFGFAPELYALISTQGWAVEIVKSSKQIEILEPTIIYDKNGILSSVTSEGTVTLEAGQKVLTRQE